MSCFSRPFVHSSTKRVTTDEGPVKNSGEIFPADQSACHAERRHDDGRAAEDQPLVLLVEAAVH